MAAWTLVTLGSEGNESSNSETISTARPRTRLNPFEDRFSLCNLYPSEEGYHEEFAQN
eukprot:CAMPEP_0178443512 /NCGR_PEP_ID=MMETSP0689_2-20121128/38944_1 /TAXON_ID=160604 /ORGANISM="Amphidinium massartii, Strain CS-259" /LENGTH=57 /DNA_ID=CAMNT_0020067543 /DNA_START=507 /DNA_END=680 /DNA_ORIENTATION=-